jgi:predicted ATPase/DNA-binding CsgD family transcriptional regulator
MFINYFVENGYVNSPTRVVHQFPYQPTPFVGRQNELSRIANLFFEPSCRLITLLGAGGIGKTRLALQAAATLQNHYPDGVYFVPLQALVSADLIVSAILEAIGLQFPPGHDSKEQLINYLNNKVILFILDNFEHLLDGTTLISEFIARAPNINLLATSRERLNIREEWVFEVQGLTVPPNDDVPDLENYSAVQLFVQNARQVKPEFRLIDEVASVARVCRLVGGMPLGLELAAGWLRVLSCDAIADEIAHSLDILETPARNVESRHRTIRAAFEPTWTRLSDEERIAFMRLSVFRGGFTREAAASVADASLHTLAALVDRSLLRAAQNERYDIHQLLLEYAEEKLKASEGLEAAQTAHSRYYASFMHQRVDDLKGPRQLAALAEINADFENVRTAWNWAAVSKNESTLEQMLEGVWLYCEINGRQTECTVMMRYAMQQLASGSRSKRLWVQLLSRDLEMEDAENMIETALQIARHNHWQMEIAFCFNQLATIAHVRRDFAKTKQLLEKSLEIYRLLGDDYYVAMVLFHLQSQNFDGSWKEFRWYAEESFHLSQKIGDRIGAAWSVSGVAMAYAREGRFAEAERLWLERIALGYETGNLTLVSSSKGQISHKIYFFLGEFEMARATAEDSLKIAASLGEPYGGNAGWGRPSLGLITCMDEDYQTAKQFFQQAVSSTGNMWIVALATWGLSLASCGLEDYDAAEEYLSAAFDFLAKIHGAAGVIAYLVVGAIILAHRGSMLRAVELLGLAFAHPIHASGWMEKWGLLTRLRSELEDTLGSDTYTAAWNSGTVLDVDDAAADLRLQFRELHPNARKTDNRIDAGLSDRELDVLRLVAVGCSNREIADRLFVSVSTVKKHINHIYDKLDVKNRTQAVAHARELHILT